MTTSRRARPRLRTALRLCGLLVFAGLSQSSWALGLGALDLQSALNERFDGKIELFDTAGLEGAEIRVSLASAEDFERVGVERFFFLTTLKFEVESAGGRPVIRASSTQPISEPYLNFLVEVLWPSGRLLKEFTVLLDPPTFTQAAAPEVVAPARESVAGPASGTIDRGQVNLPAPRQAARAGNRAPSARTSGDGTYGTTTRNDTLWQIASETLPATDVSVEQNMLAIKRKNPEAFINDNVNLLKAGYVLRTPTAAEARALDVADAAQRVVRENEAWRTGRALPETQLAGDATQPELKAQVDATQPAASVKQTATGSDGQLRIVAEAGDSAQGGVDPGANGDAASAEEVDRLSRELEAMTLERDRERELLGDQLSVKDRQLEVKDQELAELQKQINEMRETMKELSAQRAQNQSVSSRAADAAWWQSPLVLGGAAGALVLLSVIGLIMGRRRRAQAEADFYDAQTEAELAVAARAEPSLNESFDDETASLPEAAETAVAKLEDDLADSEWDIAADSTDESGADDFGMDDVEAEEGNPFAGFDDDSDAGSADGDHEGGQIGDVIGESEIYIAYGRYPQAVNLLTGALSADPDRHDVRCKLLELYAETNDQEAFDSEYAELSTRCDDAELIAAADELRGRLELDEAVALDELEPEPSSEVDDASEALDGLSLDGDGQDAETVESDAFEDAVPEASEAAESIDALGEIGLSEGADEFELELDGLDSTAQPVEDAAIDLDLDLDIDDQPFTANDPASATNGETGAGDELGGDLGMDFDPDRDVATGTFETAEAPVQVADQASSQAETPAAAALEDDLDLDALLADDGDTSAGDFDVDDEFDFADPEDGTSTKLDLAKAYIDMGDEDGARDILNEVLTEGSEAQQRQAQELLETI